MRHRPLILLSLGLLMFGCGGSSHADSRAVFIAKVNRLCTDASRKVSHGSLDAASAFAAVGAANRRWAAQLEALTGPTDLVARTKEAVALINQSLPLGDRFTADVKAFEHGKASYSAAHDADLLGRADALLMRASSVLFGIGAKSCRDNPNQEITVIR